MFLNPRRKSLVLASQECMSPKDKSKFDILNNLQFGSQIYFFLQMWIEHWNKPHVEGFGNAVCLGIVYA